MRSVCKTFEVGKKYRRVGTIGNGYECVFARQSLSVNRRLPVGIAVLKNDQDNVLFDVHEDEWHNWELVEEPRKEYFNAYKDRDGYITYGNPCDDVETADAIVENFKTYYGRLIMTHHSETHVDVEFHLNRK